MVAFIDDDLAIMVQQIRQILQARECLHHRNVDMVGRLLFAASDLSKAAVRQVKKSGKALLPLPEQVGAMDENQRADRPFANQSRCCHRLAKGCGCAQDAGFVFQHCHYSGRLIFAQFTSEAGRDLRTDLTLILKFGFDVMPGE